LCPHQALRIADAPIWATQFHPELDHSTNRMRFENYIDSYQASMSREEIDRSLESYRPSPHAGDLLRRFLLLVFP
jgi:GMP synthase-like glutamine amidotransferase